MKTFAFFCMVCVVALLASCTGKRSMIDGEANIDLVDIRKRGELVVLTANSSTSYFNYRGEPMGFQYELAQQFTQSLGLKMKLKVVNNTAEMVRCLLSGEGDLIAYNLDITPSWKDSLIYCGEENITHQVIVQRRSRDELKDVTQLLDKEVYVTPGKYRDRLVHLNEELGGGIRIHTVDADSVSAEDLITWVSEGKIDYTVATDEVAKINRTYYPNLNISLVISFDQRASWAVRKTSPQLAEAADKWHRDNINSPEFKASARRYFELNKQPAHGSILSVKDGKISHFDGLFRKYAQKIGWDWRLLASLAYTESNFNPNVVSWAGAKGLMQLMPATARAMGIPKGKEQDPEESIKGGVKYIARLQDLFRNVTDKDEQAKFVLAAYNAGAGHVTDAMAFILLKSNEEYYQDPVCKNGYFRGTETYNFVRDVIERAEMYKKKIKR